MNYRFYLSYNGIRNEIEEPVDWDDVETTLKREKTHGVAFEVAIGGLGFYGEAKQIILNAIAKSGLNANVVFEAEWRCVSNAWDNFYTGRLSLVNGFDFGDDVVSCIIEPVDAITLFNNRLDQKIDLLSDKSVGGVGIDKAIEKQIKINGQRLRYTTKGVVDIGGWKYEDIIAAAAEGEVSYGDGTKSRHGYIFPLFNSISSDIGSLSSSCGYNRDADTSSSSVTFNVINQLFENKNIRLVGLEGEVGNAEYVRWSYRLKGRVKGNYISESQMRIEIFHGINLAYYPEVGPGANTPAPGENPLIASGVVDFTNGVEFDVTRSYALKPNNDVPPSVRLSIKYFMMNNFAGKLDIEFDSESYVEFTCVTDLVDGEGNKFSYAKAIYALDGLRAITSLITDRKLDFTSNLYDDTLVNNMAITTGKYIRNGRNADGSTPPIQASFKDLYNALDSVVCLGLGMQNSRLVVNRWRHFYQTAQTIDLGDVNSIKRTLDNDMIASALKIGYAKYSTEGQSGAEDPFSDRDYITILETGKNALEKVSKVIGSGYVVEECRRVASIADNNGYKYDEDLFFLVCKPGIPETAPAVSYSGQSGTTLINSAITPLRNAKRWAPFLAIVKLGDDTDKRVIVFTAGTANAKAVVEGIAENASIDIDSIEALDATALPSPYLDSFDAPLSKKDYEAIKANPYASVAYGGMVGWIKEVKYKMSQGKASFKIYPSLATFATLYQVECEKIRAILPEEKPNTDIVFIERFDKWTLGLPNGWERLTENGALIDPISGGGAYLHGSTMYGDIIKKVIALPAGTYTIEMEVFEIFMDDPFDGISLIAGSRSVDQTSIHRMPAQQKYVFTHTGEIEHIKLKFLSARNKEFNVKLKSITIKKSAV